VIQFGHFDLPWDRFIGGQRIFHAWPTDSITRIVADW
jgi:hypothetical protein